MDARRELDVPAGVPVGCCVASLAAIGTLRPLLVAWRRVADVWPGATLLLTGFEGETDLEEAIREQALTREVRVLGERADVLRVLAAADFHVAPSGTGGVLAAMAAGKATVAAGEAELVEHGTTGWVVPPADVHALATAIAFLVQDRAAAAAMGCAARRRFEAMQHGFRLESEAAP